MNTKSRFYFFRSVLTTFVNIMEFVLLSSSQTPQRISASNNNSELINTVNSVSTDFLDRSFEGRTNS